LALVAQVNPTALSLAKKFWPGPLTLVLPKTSAVPAVVSSGRPSVAVRMPSHPLFRRLLKLAGRPLAAPSANPFGYLSPTTADHVRTGLGRKIRYILDGGRSQIGLESTIVDLRDPSRPRVLRPGKITRRELERVAGVRVAGPAVKKAKGRDSSPAVAPGQFSRHYSPRTPLKLHRRLDWQAALRRPDTEAWLFIGRPPASAARRRNVFWLDRRGLLPGAARRLFSVLRSIDQADFDKIHVEMAGTGGMGDAINDRLRRAAGAIRPTTAAGQNSGED
jgi:L-threonylcarbamoyladenylate synthase